jgi:hypothetical protein
MASRLRNAASPDTPAGAPTADPGTWAARAKAAAVVGLAAHACHIIHQLSDPHSVFKLILREMTSSCVILCNPM